MKTVWYPEQIDLASNPVLTVGNFDGVHEGHQTLIEETLKRAKETQNSAIVVTFFPHPREIIAEQPYPVLTSLSEQQIILSEVYGIDFLVVFPFTSELQQIRPNPFYTHLLIPYLSPSEIVIGSEHRFGAGGEGNISLLKRIGTEYEIRITALEEQTQNRTELGSRCIKQNLQEGKVEDANRLLGREYSIYGEVKVGKGFGTQLGFPTANVEVDERKFLPRRGTYVVRVYREVTSQSYYGVLNIGYNPVVEERETPSVEVYILDFEDEIYEEMVRLDLLTYLREEYSEGSVEDLQRWIQEDINQTRMYLHTFEEN